jgi:hypothetical protein
MGTQKIRFHRIYSSILLAVWEPKKRKRFEKWGFTGKKESLGS